MKVCGIIVEYNPLHNGHLYHIKKTKEESQCDLLIAVMSGDFVQRGEPAIIDKQKRAEFALKAGVDVVIELPYVFAVGHADLFSFGAISLLNQCGVDEIIFGSEKNDIKELTKIAKKINDSSFDKDIRNYLNKGYSYPEASHLVLSSQMKDNMDIKSNDLLGIQYIRHILQLNPKINFKTIKRTHTNYKDTALTNHTIASATSIRNALHDKRLISSYVPHYVNEYLQNEKLHFWEDYFPYLKYQIISQKTKLKNIHDINEGLENAIYQHIKQSNNIEQLVSKLTSKRYTKGKIQRVLTHILNQITKEDMKTFNINKHPKYIRILGFNEKKSSYLKRLMKKSNIPFITNIKKSNFLLVQMDLQISEIYHLIDGNTERKIPVIVY